MRSSEYLREIRKSEGLAHAVLKKIVVENGNAVFHLVTDTNYMEQDVAYAGEVSARYSAGLPASAKVVKSVPDAHGIAAAVADYLPARFPSFAAFVRPEDISATVSDGGGRVFLGVSEEERLRVQGDSVTDAVAAYLCRNFCGTWACELVSKHKESAEIVRETPEEEYLLTPRYFEIADFAAIDGGEQPKRALYLADLTKEVQNVTVCGKVDFIEERQTKSGKPFFRVTVTDVSGESIQATYFSKKATLEQVRGVKAGASVCLTGNSEFYMGRLSLNVQYFNFGNPPAGYVAEKRLSRPVPQRYKVVFPTPACDPEQGNLFGKKPLPLEFLGRNFVVFDLETTGISTAGTMDRIIEIGAVKIVRGEIAEKFSSFVACPVKLPQEIVDITHITDEMLVGAPEVSDVLADFYKFSADCCLVGQNAKQFDCKFIRYYGEKEGYLFDQPVYDTMLMAQKQLPGLTKHNLQVLADHFGLQFNHHRAFDDAFVTAKIFIELVRMDGKLPE